MSTRVFITLWLAINLVFVAVVVRRTYGGPRS